MAGRMRYVACNPSGGGKLNQFCSDMLTEVAAITDYQPTINKRRRDEFESANAHHVGAASNRAVTAHARSDNISNSRPAVFPANIPLRISTASTSTASMSDWDLTNLLLAQMNYTQANPANPYQQQGNTGYQAPAPVQTVQRGGTDDTSGGYINDNEIPAGAQSGAVDNPFSIWWDIQSSFTRYAPLCFLAASDQ